MFIISRYKEEKKSYFENEHRRELIDILFNDFDRKRKKNNYIFNRY